MAAAPRPNLFTLLVFFALSAWTFHCTEMLWRRHEGEHNRLSGIDRLEPRNVDRAPPLPIVGIFRSSVTFRAASDGTHSSTTEKHPAASSSRAWEIRILTVASPLTWTVPAPKYRKSETKTFPAIRYIGKVGGIRGRTPEFPYSGVLPFGFSTVFWRRDPRKLFPVRDMIFRENEESHEGNGIPGTTIRLRCGMGLPEPFSLGQTVFARRQWEGQFQCRARSWRCPEYSALSNSGIQVCAPY
jgi:hypothetical protein